MNARQSAYGFMENIIALIQFTFIEWHLALQFETFVIFVLFILRENHSNKKYKW